MLERSETQKPDTSKRKMEMKHVFCSDCWAAEHLPKTVHLHIGPRWRVTICLGYNTPVYYTPGRNIPTFTSSSIIAPPRFNYRECHLHIKPIQIVFSVCHWAESSEAGVPTVLSIVLYWMKRESNTLSFCTGNRITHDVPLWKDI